MKIATVFIALITMLLSNSSFAENTKQTAAEKIHNAAYTMVGTSMVIAGVGFVLNCSYLPSGALMMSFGLSGGSGVISTAVSADVTADANQKNNLELAKKAILAEAVEYQTSGEMGAVLEAFIDAIKAERPDFSNNEVIDALVESLHNGPSA